MDANQIRELRPRLTRYLHEFDECFSRRDTARYLPIYVEGQLSDLKEKSCEPIALAAGIPPRNLQQFLSNFRWNDDRVRDRLQQIVMRDHAGPNSIAIFDETSDVKKGNKTPGVLRQWCGTLGKKENCMVTVHLSYARDDFHCLLDGDLYLPESWAKDRSRCRAAGIPDEIVYRPKWRIALDLYDRARRQGMVFDWSTFDERYDSKPAFLRELHARGQKFVGEIPTNFHGWIQEPKGTERPYRGRRGPGHATPRLVAGGPRLTSIENMLKHSPSLRDQAWVCYQVKDGEKGPLAWEVKRTRIVVKDEQGLPDMPLLLLVARNVLDPNEIKYFVSNAPAHTAVTTLLLVAFSRWRVERCFQDQKQEVGFDQWEGRCWLGLKRHLILTSVSYLFLAKTRECLAEKTSGVDRVSSSSHSEDIGSELVAQRSLVDHSSQSCLGGPSTRATTQRHGSMVSCQEHSRKTREIGH